MSAAQADSVLRYLHDLAQRRGPESQSDGELLRRFAARRDEAAFAALVRRHGPLVLRVCERLLHDPNAAEDVFQATFLVLARQAGSLRNPDSVGCFLHGVAYRLARRACVEAARRRYHEGRSSVAPPADPLAEVSGRELLAVLEGELNNLPSQYRLPLILCCLQGRTRDEAARQAGWSLRTLQRRLERGRALLRARLARRGLASAGLLPGALLAPAEAPAVPAKLLTPTVQAALAFLTPSAGGGRPSPRAAALAGGILRTTSLVRLKVAASLLLALALLGAGLHAVAPPAARPPRAPAASPPPAPKPPPPPPALPAEVERALRADDAVAAGVQWIVRRQADDGHWSLDGSFKNDVAATSFALLPLLAAGHTHQRRDGLHPYARTVERGLAYLKGRQARDGRLDRDMYANGLATLTLCEAYALTADPALKAPAQQAVDFVVAAQHQGGGWRYAPKQPGDTSVTVYQILALTSARRAGLKIPGDVFTRAGKYLDSAATPDKSGYQYVPGAGAPSPTMSAAGHLCRLLVGGSKEDRGLVKWAADARRQPPSEEKGDLYYYHLATRALHARGGDDWAVWRPKMRTWLLDRQERDAQRPDDRGSWPATSLRIGPSVGRLMATSLALLTLQWCLRDDPAPALPARDLSPREVADLYGALRDDDFVKARQALRVLASSPRASVPFLHRSLRPVPPADAPRVRRLIADLANDDFTVRERAAGELEKIGEPAHPALRKALEGKPELEVRRRIEHVLAATESELRSPELRRSMRAVEVLVSAGTPEARRLLDTLAAGAPESPLTHAARSGLQRLDQRRAP